MSIYVNISWRKIEYKEEYKEIKEENKRNPNKKLFKWY